MGNAPSGTTALSAEQRAELIRQLPEEMSTSDLRTLAVTALPVEAVRKLSPEELRPRVREILGSLSDDALMAWRDQVQKRQAAKTQTRKRRVAEMSASRVSSQQTAPERKRARPTPTSTTTTTTTVFAPRVPAKRRKVEAKRYKMEEQVTSFAMAPTEGEYKSRLDGLLQRLQGELQEIRDPNRVFRMYTAAHADLLAAENTLATYTRAQQEAKVVGGGAMSVPTDAQLRVATRRVDAFTRIQQVIVQRIEQLPLKLSPRVALFRDLYEQTEPEYALRENELLDNFSEQLSEIEDPGELRQRMDELDGIIRRLELQESRLQRQVALRQQAGVPSQEMETRLMDVRRILRTAGIMLPLFAQRNDELEREQALATPETMSDERFQEVMDAEVQDYARRIRNIRDAEALRQLQAVKQADLQGLRQALQESKQMLRVTAAMDPQDFKRAEAQFRGIGRQIAIEEVELQLLEEAIARIPTAKTPYQPRQGESFDARVAGRMADIVRNYGLDESDFEQRTAELEEKKQFTHGPGFITPELWQQITEQAEAERKARAQQVGATPEEEKEEEIGSESEPGEEEEEPEEEEQGEFRGWEQFLPEEAREAVRAARARAAEAYAQRRLGAGGKP